MTNANRSVIGEIYGQHETGNCFGSIENRINYAKKSVIEKLCSKEKAGHKKKFVFEAMTFLKTLL